MTRLEAWESLVSHPWHGKTMKKLSESEKRWSRMFIQDNKNLTFAEFRTKVHLFNLDRIDKVRSEILELLSAANSQSGENI